MIKLSSPIAQLLFGVAAIAPGAIAGYCNWGPNGDAASSICDGSVQGGDWCNVDQYNCETGCSGRWCTNDGGGGGGGPTTPAPTTTTGSSGIATTTRYWDCSGGACACSYVPSGFTEPAHCHSNAMFDAPPGNVYGAKYYGAAAISASLGGGNWMAEGCGKCWKVTGTSNIQAYSGIETTLVLKGTNFCPDGNPLCGAGPHFDIAAPGFDVLAYSFAHTCPEREPEEAAGFAACGTWLIDNPDPDVNCDCSLFKSPVLRKGCEIFYSLKWDNPVVTYEEVDCPQELSDLHCSYPYAFEDNSIPETCSNNDFSSPSSTTTSTSTTTSSTTSSSSTTTATAQPPATTTTTTTTTSTTTQAVTTQPPPTTTTSTSTTTTSTTSSSSPNQSSYCCSWNYSSCGDSEWCNASESNCEVCGGRLWMQPNANCIPLDGACTSNKHGCCNPLGNVSCNGNRWYRQCQL